TTRWAVLICLVAWVLPDRVIDPRLRGTPVDGAATDMPTMQALEPCERRGLLLAVASMLALAIALVLTAMPAGSAWRALADAPSGAGELLVATAPLMQSIVPLIFILFLVPGVVYGYAAGSVKNHRDV